MRDSRKVIHRNPVKRTRPVIHKVVKPQKGQKPYRRIVLYRRKKTGRQVTKEWARRHPRAVKREHGYVSRITSKRIPKSMRSENWKIQAMRELGHEQVVTITTKKGKVVKRYRHRVSEKGARSQLKGINTLAGMTKEQFKTVEPTYRRWIKWLAQRAPDLLPPSLRVQAEDLKEPLNKIDSLEEAAKLLSSLRAGHPELFSPESEIKITPKTKTKSRKGSRSWTQR